MWWKDMLWGFWNGMTAWFVLIAHALGKLEGKPVFDTKRRGNWYVFGFLLLWAIAVAAGSRAALVAAAFQHAFIWAHYLWVERPNMQVIYGDRPLAPRPG